MLEARRVASARGSHEAFVFLLLVVAATWVGTEFGPGPISPWFRATPFGIPAQFFLYFFLLLAVSPYVISSPRFDFAGALRSERLLGLAAFGWAVIGFAIGLGILRGAPELFADWRNLVIVVITSIFAARFLGSREWRSHILSDLATAYGLLAIPHLIGYAAGSGASVLGVRTTVFDGATLYLCSFSAVTALWFYVKPPLRRSSPLRSLLLSVAGISASLLVLLSFRRSFWLAWIVGIVVVLTMALRTRETRSAHLYGSLLGLGLLFIVATVALGVDTVVARLESFLPSSANEFTVTNSDHVNDIIDAWQIIRNEPILGLGIGTTYETNLIADWKTESFDVHNAFVHVWLKFGVLGMLAYAAFHVGLVRSALKRPDLIPIAAFLVGETVATMFGTWPYGSFQMSVFHGVLVAILFVNLPRINFGSISRPVSAVGRS